MRDELKYPFLFDQAHFNIFVERNKVKYVLRDWKVGWVQVESFSSASRTSFSHAASPHYIVPLT